MRLKDVAEFLACSRSQVYRLIKRGELKSIMVGESRRVPVSELIDYATGSTHEERMAEQQRIGDEVIAGELEYHSEQVQYFQDLQAKRNEAEVN